jgi:hypothetical protein
MARRGWFSRRRGFVFLLATALGSAGAATIVRAADEPASVILHSGDDVAAIVATAPPGSAFVFAPGLYRLVSITPKAGDRFIGLQHAAVLTGAMKLDGFVADGAVWRAPVDVAQLCAGDAACDRPVDLFIDDAPQRRVDAVAAVAAGTYLVDRDTGTIILGSDPSGKMVEISVTPFAFAGTVAAVRLGGLVIEKYAVPAGMAAVGGRGQVEDWTVEDSDIRLNHGIGLSLGDDSRAIRNVIRRNGAAGIAVSGKYVTLERNELVENGRAGVEMIDTLHATLRENYGHGNHGPGLWAARDDEATLYERNRVEDNDGPGILHEMSGSAILRDTVASGNGLGADGKTSAAQILIRNAHAVDAYGNEVTVSESGAGILLADSIARADRNDQPACRDNFVHDNDITMAGAAGSAAGLVADDAGDVPDTAGNRFDRNRYHVPDRTGRYWRWPGIGAALTLETFRKAAHQENDSTLDYLPMNNGNAKN